MRLIAADGARAALAGIAPNGYGDADIIDCDGPIGVSMFALPALAIYAVALLFFMRLLRAQRSLVCIAHRRLPRQVDGRYRCAAMFGHGW